MIRSFSHFFLPLLLALGGTPQVSAQIRSDFMLADSASSPAISLDDNGNIHAVWIEQRDSVIYSNFDTLGHELESARRKVGSGSVSAPRLAVSHNYVSIVWSLSTPFWSSSILNRNISLDGSTISDQIKLNDPGNNICYWPDIAFLDDTTFVAVWAGEGFQTMGFEGIFGQIATTSLDSLGSNILITDHTVADSIQPNKPRVASLPGSDNFLVVWRDDFSGNMEVYGRLFQGAGVPLDSSFRISESPASTDPWFFLSTTANDQGEYVVVWATEHDSTDWIIQLRLYSATGLPLGSITQVNQANDGAEVYPYHDIAFDHNGNFIVVWEQTENLNYRIYAQRYLADGSALGANFRISTEPQSGRNHYDPSVVLHNGIVYTTWTVSYQDTSYYRSIWANIIDFYDPPLNTSPTNAVTPTSFYLYQNYPNPFNAETSFHLDLPYQARVRLNVHDLRGRLVSRLANTTLSTGTHRFTWRPVGPQGRQLAAGVYFVRLEISGANSNISRNIKILYLP